MAARAKSTWPVNLTPVSFVFYGYWCVGGIHDFICLFSPCLLLFLQHRGYLTFKKVFDERSREEQKKAWEMYTPTWEMDRRVHSGGTWKQIGIGREIDAHQGFLQGGRTCGVHRWDGNVWMERHCGWVMTFFFFFLANSALKVRKSINLPSQIY